MFVNRKPFAVVVDGVVYPPSEPERPATASKKKAAAKVADDPTTEGDED